jgi:hypothetical protein
MKDGRLMISASMRGGKGEKIFFLNPPDEEANNNEH